jgi:hypothetical protein
MRKKVALILAAAALVVTFTAAVGATLVWDNINGPWVSEYPGIHDACGTSSSPEGELTQCEIDYVTNNNN